MILNKFIILVEKLPYESYDFTKGFSQESVTNLSFSLWASLMTLVKSLPANAGDVGSIPGSGGSPGEGNDNPLQQSCLGNPTDRGAWSTTVHGVTKESDTTQ